MTTWTCPRCGTASIGTGHDTLACMEVWHAHAEALAEALDAIRTSMRGDEFAQSHDLWDLLKRWGVFADDIGTAERGIALLCEAVLARLPADTLAERRALEAVAQAAKLRRNTRIRNQRAFAGEWIAIPAEDFDALQTARAALGAARRASSRCHADTDGDCEWSGCPQVRDGEPARSGRHCPLDAAQQEGGA